jgi:hypothetical protein
MNAGGEPATPYGDTISRMLEGAVDLHIHTAPSPFPRRIDIVDAARSAQESGFRAIVAKSHHHSTVTDVLALRQHGLDELEIEVHSGIALNSAVGGLNPHAVDQTLKMGGRIVWFPTVAAPRHIEHHHANPDMKFPKVSFRLMDEAPADVFDADHRLRPEVHEIIALIRDADAILATGHMDPPSISAVLEAAKAAGVTRMLVNHPTFVVEATMAEASHWVDLGAVIEHSICIFDERSTFYQQQVDVLVAWLREMGPENTALGSDLGQVNNPLPVEAYRSILGELLAAGFSEEELRLTVRDNPARLLLG